MSMNEKEIEFMKFMEEQILPNRRSVSYDVLKHAGNLVGIFVNTSCRSCAQKSGMDLLNKYGQMKQAWIDYNKELLLKEQTKIEEVFTQYTNEVIKEEEKVIEKVIEKIEEIEVPMVEVTEYKQLPQKPKTLPKKKTTNE